MLVCPGIQLRQSAISHLLRGRVLPKGLDEASAGIDEVEVNRVVDEVIVPRSDICGGGEVHPVGPTDGLDGLVRARQADQARVEIGNVSSHLGHGVPRRVTRDEYRIHDPFPVFLLYCTVSRGIWRVEG